uniref:Endosomal/lysosomal proton channel TMEM175 n=1 Tax=Sus scrofa TaxID=9823 RepID=A0A8D0P1N4_PIG
MTFLIVTVAWAAHTRLFQIVGKIDDTLALLNLACMMTITFLPFTFSLMVTFPEVPLGIFLFCVCVIAIGAIQALIVVYAFHFPHLLSPQIEGSAHRALHRRHILGIILQGPTLCLAAACFSLFFYPASYLLMATVVFLPYVSKAAGWCRDRLAGSREPPAHSLEFFTFDLHEPLSKERVEAFSDGVYAIVATLLILDIWSRGPWGFSTRCRWPSWAACPWPTSRPRPSRSSPPESWRACELAAPSSSSPASSSLPSGPPRCCRRGRHCSPRPGLGAGSTRSCSPSSRCTPAPACWPSPPPAS